MKADFLDGLGLLGDALGVISFFSELVPEKPPPDGAAIRIKAGNPGGDNPGMDGEITAAYAWDTNNRWLGQSSGDKVEVGDIADLTIDSFSPGSRADYVGVSVDKDAVCIAWIAVKMKDDTEGGSWTGDIGYECGQNWYEQSEMAGFLDEDEEEEYIPRCTWLDADHTEDVPSASMKFDVMAYGRKVEDTLENSGACDYTLWGEDNSPISSRPGRRGAGRPRLAWMEERLIVSNITRHKAEGLCSSETSWGPDFVGTDGYFCDMGSKTLSPLCSTADVNGCVNIDEEGNRITKRSTVAKRSVEIAHKSYGTIKHWG